MKTVSGEVVSCESVSLSKAARILSKFAFSDNEASPAYAAYLRRASVSFDELAQLHKECKSSGSYQKVKKQHSHGVVTDGTVKSVKKRSKDGLVVKEIGSSKRKEHCEVNVDQETERHSLGRSVEVQKVEEIVERNDGDVGGGGAGKKSKKKRESNQTKMVTIKDEYNGDCDGGVSASELKNSTESVDGSKVSKKKKKRDKHENEKHDVAAKIEKEVQSGHHSLDDHNEQAIESDKNYGDKWKKHKKDQHNGDLAAVDVIEVKNEIESLDGSKEMKKKKKKKDRHAKEQSDNAVDFEKDFQNRPRNQDVVYREATQITENNDDDQKKHKKNKKKIQVKAKNFSSDIRVEEQRDEMKVDHQNLENLDKGGEQQKHKKKRIREGKERVDEGNLEIEAANNRENRKRKHGSVTNDGLDGSEEQHKSKKKKR